MGKYFNPTEDVLEGRVGRRIGPASGDHNWAKRELRQGEHLYFAGDRLISWLVVCVDDPNEFKHFYDQYAQGMFVKYSLYAFSEEEHAQAD